MCKIAIVVASVIWGCYAQGAESSDSQLVSRLFEAGRKPFRADVQKPGERSCAQASRNPLTVLGIFMLTLNPVHAFKPCVVRSPPAIRRLQTTLRCATHNVQMGQTEDRLAELGITLPAYPAPLASYIPWVRTGNLIFISGHVPFMADMKTLVQGRVGFKSTEFNAKDGAGLARHVGLELISTLQTAVGVGNLDKVKKIVKLVGFVNCPDGFTEQPEVINGCSNLMVEVFGETRGTHARSAVGTNSLPRNVPVEIEMIAEVTD